MGTGIDLSTKNHGLDYFSCSSQCMACGAKAQNFIVRMGHDDKVLHTSKMRCDTAMLVQYDRRLINHLVPPRTGFEDVRPVNAVTPLWRGSDDRNAKLSGLELQFATARQAGLNCTGASVAAWDADLPPELEG